MPTPTMPLRPLLQGFLDGGYRFQRFSGSPISSSVVLRHDIDFSLDSALEVAKVERELGISASYFFMLTSNFYNLLSPISRRKVRAIQNLGHEISIHYDTTAYTDVDRGFAEERETFERAFETSIEIVSLHRPQGFLDDNNRKLPGVRHTYEDTYFREMRYFSDSRGGFHHGHPLDGSAFLNREPIHLLLHPIWWTNQGNTPSDKLRSWQRVHFDFLDDEVSKNCEAYSGRSTNYHGQQ